jgi:hypothetical protein
MINLYEWYTTPLFMSTTQACASLCGLYLYFLSIYRSPTVTVAVLPAGILIWGFTRAYATFSGRDRESVSNREKCSMSSIWVAKMTALQCPASRWSDEEVYYGWSFTGLRCLHRYVVERGESSSARCNCSLWALQRRLQYFTASNVQRYVDTAGD